MRIVAGLPPSVGMHHGQCREEIHGQTTKLYGRVRTIQCRPGLVLGPRVRASPGQVKVRGSFQGRLGVLASADYYGMRSL